MLPWIETLALFGCAVYATIPAFWLTLHPFTGHWRSRGRHSFKVILPLWLVYILIAIAALFPWRTRALYTTPYAYIPGALLIVMGLLLYILSSRGFTHVQLSGLAEVEPERHAQRLVTSGIRSRVRHPIYLGHLCELLGWTVCFGTISLIALTTFAIVTGFFMLRLEDNELEQRFGKPYSDYRRSVPTIVPRLF
jgi:methanethiol S-methyltransferase